MMHDEARPLSTRWNSIWMLLGNIIGSACQWGIVISIAKLGNAEMVGRFSLAQAVTAPVFMLTNLSLRAVQATDARDEYDFRDYVHVRIILIALALIICILIVAWMGPRETTPLVILAMALAKSAESMSDIYYGLFQKHERMDRIAVSVICRGVFGLSVTSLVIYLTGSILWGIVALTAAWATILTTYDVKNGRMLLQMIKLHGEARPGHLVLSRCAVGYGPMNVGVCIRLIMLALPLGVVMLLISLNMNVPRYFVDRYWGDSELGYFAAVGYIGITGYTLVTALGQAALPRLAKHCLSDVRAFWRLVVKLILLVSVLGALGIAGSLLFGELALRIAYGPEYSGYAIILTWFMLWSWIGYVNSILGYAITAMRYFRVQAPLFFCATASSMCACWLLVPERGALGAVEALVISCIVQLVGSAGIVLYGIIHDVKDRVNEDIHPEMRE